MMFVEKCFICYEVSHSNKRISKCDDYGRDCLEKLKYITPEVEWCNDLIICEECTSDLMVACKFRERCLNAHTNSLKQEFFSANSDDTQLKFENDINIFTDNETDQDELIAPLFICYNCERNFGNKNDLTKHIEQEHKEELSKNIIKYKRKEKCSKCGRKFTLSSSLKEHHSICDGVSRHRKIHSEYQCDTCNKYYTTEKILNAHKKKCKREGIKVTKYQCTKCNSYYISAKTLRDHKKRGCKKDECIEEVVCKFCQEPFKSSFILKKHILDAHNLNTCDVCDMKFECLDEYNIHKKKKHENNKDYKEKKFTCEICDESFILVKILIEHCVSKHSMDEKSVKPYSCDICKHRFRSSTNLVTHRLYHNRIRTNICTICGKSFITKNDLLAHESTHYTLRKYKCDECEKAFKTNTNLRTHCLIVHTDPLQWKYICRICNKRFPQKSNHDQHLRRHIGEKNFQCPLCMKAFTSKSEMQGHVTFHSNERPYKCNQCGKDYRKRHTYTVHMAKVHGIGNAKVRVRERKYTCHICPGKFYDRWKLARHLCTHSGSKPFPCYACEKKFTDKSYLKHHLKTFHNIVELKTESSSI